MRRILTAAGVMAILAGGSVLYISTSGASSHSPAAVPVSATATITRTTLVDTDQEQGTLGFDQARTLSAAASGVLTALPGPGTVIRRDHRLYSIDLHPARLFYGSVPLSRTLQEGVADGPDVKELERNLHELGYHPGTIDDHFSVTTASAVKSWQDAHDMTETGRISVGDIAFLPGTVRIGNHRSEPGDQVAAGRTLADTTSTTRIATVNLPVTDAGVAHTGDKTILELPTGSTTQGTIIKVGTVATVPTPRSTQVNAATTATIPVTIRVEHPEATGALDQAPVTVDFSRDHHSNVLSVPVTALVALSGGGYAVDVVHGTATQRVRVQTGLFSTTGGGAGRVEISGAGIAEGEKVVIPQ